MIPPEQNAAFVAAMERVLGVYRRPYDSKYPVVCLDEMPRQLIGETRLPLLARSGSVAKYDYEYKRNGTCNVFMAVEPLVGKRMTKVTEHRKMPDWAQFTAEIAEAYPEAEKIILVEDNLNTHKPASWYETFSPEKARMLMERFELVYTPKHGSWLNVAEIELNVLSGQCLSRRIGEIETLRQEVEAWEQSRNHVNATVNWQFTAEDARIKLKRLYPTLDS